MLTGSLHETESRLYISSWKKLWKLCLPPKIISFLWRLCNNCIPVSVRLLDKGMNLSTCCVLCGQGQEHYLHLFYDCPYSSSCWTVANVDKPTLTTDEFPVWLLKLIDDLDPVVMCSIAMIYGVYGGNEIRSFRRTPLYKQRRRWSWGMCFSRIGVVLVLVHLSLLFSALIDL